MSDTRRTPSIPPFTLAQDLSSVGTTVKTQSAVDWRGAALDASLFNTDYVPATLVNDTRTRVEFILIDVSSIGSLTTTGATIYKRGLPYTAEGNDTTDETTSILRQFAWTQGETKLLIGTNPPWMYGQFASRKNDEDILGIYRFFSTARPKLNTDVDSAVNEEFPTVGQLNRTAFAGAPDATTAIKGIVELATQAESDSGATTGGTTASLVPTPLLVARSVQKLAWSYGVDAQASDTYVVALSVAPTALVAGQKFLFKANTANTGAATVNFNGLGAATIKKVVAGAISDLENNDILAGMLVLVGYDGTNFYMLNTPGTSISSAIAFEVTSVFSATDITGAELETLSAGATSDANTLHKHAKKFGADSFAPTAATDTKVITHNLGVIPRLIRIKYAASTARSDATQSQGEGISDGTTYATIYLAKTGNPLYDWDTDTAHIIVADDVTGAAGWNATLITLTTTQFTIDVDSFTTATDIVFTWEVE